MREALRRYDGWFRVEMSPFGVDRMFENKSFAFDQAVSDTPGIVGKPAFRDVVANVFCHGV
jgi:hypothetical protein